MARNTTKAVRKATTSKGIPTGTTISYGDERVEHLAGPYVPLPKYFRHYRHWCATLNDGEPRPIDRQFLELQREGIDCLYRTLNALVEETYPHGSDMRRPTTTPNLGRWGDMHREHAKVKRAWALNIGAVVHRVGHMLPTDPKDYAPPYGATYARAHYQSAHSVMVPHVVTPEEAEHDGMPRAAGSVAWSNDPTQHTIATAEKVGHRWAEVFTEEVRHLLGDEPNDETLKAFADLHANLKGYVFGSREGARVIQRMKPKDVNAEGEYVDSFGEEVLAAFGRIRERLNALLGEVAEDHFFQPDPNPNRLAWKGNTMELAELFHVLETNGWIDGGRTRSKLAQRLAALFTRSDGEPLELATLKTYMGKAYRRTPREGVEFLATKNPDKTQ